MNAALLWALIATAGPTPRQQLIDSGMEIVVLRESLRVEHCVDCIDAQRKDPDRAGEELATRLARMHEERATLLQALKAPLNEVTSERLAAADAWMDAFSLDPNRVEPLERAEQAIVTVQQEFTDSQISTHKVAARARRRLAVLQDRVAPPAAAPPATCPSPQAPTGLTERKDCAEAWGDPTPRPPKPIERRIKLRFEGGDALHLYERSEPGTPLYIAAAGYLHAAVLGRFAFRRFAVAFGPYFSWFRSDPRTVASYADVIDSGAHVELDVYFSPRSRRVVSLHPFLEFGVGRIHPVYAEDAPASTQFVGDATSGATFAPGLSLCFAEGMICPTVRIKILPDVKGIDLSPQFGLALSIPPARPLRRAK